MSNDRQERQWRECRIIYNNDGNVKGVTNARRFHEVRNIECGWTVKSDADCPRGSTVLRLSCMTGLPAQLLVRITS